MKCDFVTFEFHVLYYAFLLDSHSVLVHWESNMTSTIQTKKEIEKAREAKRRELSARLKPGEPIVVNTNGERFVLKGRPCELSSESFVPPRRIISKERTFYNTEPKVSNFP